ncbi:ninjurin-A-like [Topomyia yanbarensis]|uniref:ninjurin-A-like n=1 Tax=Topomyia yanbarensis TaxID=2498891 RepID=UPI00273AB56E|nr:ninjurin-A-like [Topomyia yanbarensis]XP_058830346.1 ninjurin-A-like [Topomyia yanbarensis]
MSNPNDSDNKHVEITIDEDKSNEPGTNPTPVTPVVPDVVSQSKEEVRPPKSNSNTRGRQLKPERAGNRSRSNSRSPNRRLRRDTVASQNDAVPLLPSEEGLLPRQKPPIAGPEMDDDGPDGDRNYGSNDDRGIDDGFLGDGQTGRRTPGRRNSIPTPFPYSPEYGPDLPPGVITTTTGTRVIPDLNVYQQKKSLAQGMMDLALLSANANQLRYVLESNVRHPYFYVSLIFISTSIICQVAVGIGLIWKSRYNIKNQDDFCKADRINNMVTIGIFIITLVNVLISAFGVADTPKAG